MDSIIWIVLIAVAGFAFWKYAWPKADVNQDGKVDAADASAVVTKVADVNHDGKVDVTDAVEAVKKTTRRAKTVAVKATEKSKSSKVKKNG